MAERCPKCGRKVRRSNPANARYWLLLHMIAEKVKPDGQQYSPETWHHWAKLRWIGADDVKLPNGKTVVVPKSSAELAKDEFHEFAFQVEAWANERGVFLDEVPA